MIQNFEIKWMCMDVQSSEQNQNEIKSKNKKGFIKLQSLVWSSFEKYQSLVQVYVWNVVVDKCFQFVFDIFIAVFTVKWWGSFKHWIYGRAAPGAV